MSQMRYLYFPIVAIILLFFTSCTDNPYNFQKDGIEFQIKKDKIIVTNQENSNLYYFIVNRNTLPFITWVPISTDDNRIEPFQRKEFLLEEIFGVSEETNEVSFFHWKSEDTEPGETLQIVLELK